MCSPKKLTINLAIESIDSLKKRATKLKNIECPKVHVDPCIERLQVIPAPIRRIEKKQIEICKCPTVEFICPPVPCVCPPCPICPTPAERFKALLKAGLKLSVLYVMVKFLNILSSTLRIDSCPSFMNDEHSKHQEIRSWRLFKTTKIGKYTAKLSQKKLLLGFQTILLFGILRWTVEQELWGGAEHTSQLTNYYKSIVNALVYGEQKGSEMAMNSRTPGFFEIRQAVYKTQLLWNKIISTLFYVTIGLPLHYVNKVKESFAQVVECDDDDDDETD